MVWIDVDMGGRDKESSLIVCGMVADGKKMGDPPPFLMGEAFSEESWGSPLPFILCYNKGNATWAAVASKDGKDET